MKPTAVITFVIIASFVWGGLLLIVSTALRRESSKTAAGDAPADENRTLTERES